MNLTKLAFALGSSVGARHLARTVQSITMDDVLSPMGLERRRTGAEKTLMALGWIGVGALAGAGAALLLAPSSGKELRERVSHELDEAKMRVGKELRAVEQRAEQAAARANNGGSIG